MNLLLLINSLLLLSVYCSDKPRGIPFSKLSFYEPNVPFKCLDGSGTIVWNKVNDDYCDCRDASDEPGTSACSNGFFYCDNKGHRGMNIFSSRVNDGICDCCDGGDEYSGIVHCNNTCWELGEKSREHDKRIREAAVRGHEIYLQYVKDYTTNVALKKSRLETIKEQLDSISEDRLAVERSKTDAEALESEAKKTAEEQWKRMESENETMQEKKRIKDAFLEIDANSDGRISIAELQTYNEFDIDQNGEVSAEEAKEYLNEYESVDEIYFTDTVWPNIKQIFKFKVKTETTVNDTDGANHEPSELSPEDEHIEKSPVVVDKPTREYDESTQSFIDAADLARNAYNEINDKYRKLEEEKKSIEDLLNIDYGTNSVFYVLAESDQCYDLTDREYLYRLCPFRRTSQMPKEGGSETELGRWGRWSGADSLHASQTYENGAGCWNGPNRSTKVDLVCGVENRLVEASEPSRCEYRFEFETPAACDKTAEELSHDEL